ncbi:MAG: cytochrome P450 [Pseudomonadota bacterium]
MSASLPFLDLSNPDFSTRSVEVTNARARHWCARTPFGLAVLRHREVGLLLRDKRLRQGSHAWPDTNGFTGSFAEFWKRSVISLEGAEHKALRQLAVQALEAEFVASLKPAFTDIAQAQVGHLSRYNSGEFMQEFAIPFAGKAICVLMGVPVADWQSIAQDASDLGLAMGVDCRTHQPRFNTACDRLTELSRELIAAARAAPPTNTYTSRLVELFDGQSQFPEQALVDLMVISIFGGVDTTRSQLGLAMTLFIDNLDQWEWLFENPDFTSQAVEEIIRSRPTTTWATREAVCDFEFQGETIPMGTTLHMLVHASAQDPAICDDPHFDITKRRKVHFGFGGGAHHCIGHQVARTDIACALRALNDRFERIEYAGLAEFLPDSGNTSPISLPLEFSPRL